MEKLCAVIALGYGRTQGVPHSSKTAGEASEADGPIPDWFQRGVDAALRLPLFSLHGRPLSVMAERGYCRMFFSFLQ